MINKPIIIGIVAFLIISVAFCCIKPPTVSRVNFSNADVALNNGSNTNSKSVSFSKVDSVKNENLKYKNRKIQNKNLAVNLENKNQKYENTSDVLSNQNLDSQNNMNMNQPVSSVNKQAEPSIKERDIDWATWRSNVVNLVLETSYNVRELDKYEVMTWFYYKFNVHSNGKITDVKVYSLNMYQEDIQIVGRMLESLSYNPVLAFPKNTKRDVVEVSALYVFDDAEQRTNPNDFNDVESYKYYEK